MKQKIEAKINNESFTDKVSTIMLEILNLRKNSALLESIIKDCNTSSNNAMQNMSFSNWRKNECKLKECKNSLKFSIFNF